MPNTHLATPPMQTAFRSPRSLRRTLTLTAALATTIVASALSRPFVGTLAAQGVGQGGMLATRAALPFGVGERLTYAVRVAKLGQVGHSSMAIVGPVDVRGTSTWLLQFDFEARFAFMKAHDHTQSWLDAGRMSSLRFRKEEHHPLASGDAHVELYPAERRWVDADGGGGDLGTPVPLDELSFIYFVRTLALDADTSLRFDRHYDAARNPTTVRVVKRDTITVPAGRFPVLLVEMRVVDPRHVDGNGLIRLWLSDDERRVPVRIESRIPVFGTATMSLETETRGADHSFVARR